MEFLPKRCCTSPQPVLCWDFLVGLFLFALYLFTLHHGPGGRISPGDAAKFQYIALILGVPHAPGFPLYVLLLRLWLYFNPLFSHATFANLFSAACTALAAPLLHRALCTAGITFYPSLLLTVTLFLSPRLWMAATQAGPLALSFLLVSAIAFAVSSFLSTRSPRALAAGIFLTLLAAGHDTLLLWWAPFLLLHLFAHSPHGWRSRLPWLALAAGLLIGFGSHLYTYARSWQLAPVLEYVGPRTSLLRLFSFMLGAQFWPNYGFLSWHAMLTERLPRLFRDLSEQLSLSFLGLALPGFLIAWLTRFRLAFILSAALVVNLAFSLHQFSPDPPASFWLAAFACALAAAVAIDTLLLYASRLRPVILLFCSICLATHVFFSFRTLRSAHADYQWRDLLLAAPPNAIILTKDVYATSQILNYFHYTDPFVRRRALSARDAVTPAITNALVFLESSVFNEICSAGLNATMLASNSHGAVFMLANAVP